MHKKQSILQNQNVFAETEYNMTSLGLFPASKLGKTNYKLDSAKIQDYFSH